ncbi:MAG: FimB/Mfa2 family fimbrial subunit [Bacteroidaceae bacterium]|nr:FimB/Mfa2 family fimbrial subunit [Bacteroidaceae bacterium]
MKVKKVFSATLARMALLLFAAMFCYACDSPTLDNDMDDALATEANVILHFKQFEQETFSRAATDITDICSRLDVGVFDADGAEVKIVSQQEGDADYGTVTMSLTVGTYHLVVIAHNGNGASTIASPEKVTFPDNKLTDTFYYDGDLVVTAEQQSHDLTLRRAVAMFRMVLTDKAIPADVATFKFSYSGGSSTFSPATGYGTEQSSQTEILPVAEDGIYEVYTLPNAEEDLLTKMLVTAQDASGNALKELYFENIPVTRNMVTRYTGRFFNEGGGEDTGSVGLHMTADPVWEAVHGYKF